MSRLVAGCIPVPMAAKATPERASKEQLASIQAGVTTREAVEASLGPPDLRRANDHYWVYSWTTWHGEWWLVPLWPNAPPENTGSGLYATYHTLFVEFDSAAIVRRAEFGERRGEALERFCNGQDVCVEHWYWKAIDDLRSALTVPLPADVPIVDGARAAATTGCRLVLTAASDLAEEGLQFLVDALWPEKLWLPKDAYATVELAAGSHDLSGCGDTRARIECQPGETLWLVLGDAREKEARCAGTELALARQAAAEPSLTGLRRVLLPERPKSEISTDVRTQPY
jgi:hypothetical protein